MASCRPTCSPRCACCRRCSRPSRCGFDLEKAVYHGTLGYTTAGTLKDHAMARPIVIHADWDAEAGVWVATTRDIGGLVTEADSIEALRAKLPGMILDLLEENGVSDLPASIEIIARASDRLAAAE